MWWHTEESCFQVCRYYDENIVFVVDKFHIKGHVEPKCKLDSPDCVYHPDLERNKLVFKDSNLEVFVF